MGDAPVIAYTREPPNFWTPPMETSHKYEAVVLKYKGWTPYGHWCAQKKRMCRYHGWKFRKIFEAEEAEDDGILILTWYLGITFTGVDYNTSMADVVSIAISETEHSVVSYIVQEVTHVAADDLTWHLKEGYYFIGRRVKYRRGNRI